MKKWFAVFSLIALLGGLIVSSGVNGDAVATDMGADPMSVQKVNIG